MSSLNLFQTNKEPENTKTQVFESAEFGKILELTTPAKVASAISTEFDKGGGEFNSYPLETAGGVQNFTFINESELYFVLMRSDKPKAKPFRLWVTKEVLPAIRKTGEYKIQKQETLISADFLRKIKKGI